jgi:hypothetical protein
MKIFFMEKIQLMNLKKYKWQKENTCNTSHVLCDSKYQYGKKNPSSPSQTQGKHVKNSHERKYNDL